MVNILFSLLYSNGLSISIFPYNYIVFVFQNDCSLIDCAEIFFLNFTMSFYFYRILHSTFCFSPNLHPTIHYIFRELFRVPFLYLTDI